MAQNVEPSELWKTKANSNSFFICNVCRLCANICDNVVPIFDKINEKESVYAKLKKCLPSILVLESDIKPKQICLSCVSKLDSCFSFVEMSLNADFKFDTLLQSRLVPQIQIVSDQTLSNKSMINNQDLPWLQLKQESEWTDLKPRDVQNGRSEQKESFPLVPDLSIQLCQQKSFQQHSTVQQLPSTSTQFHFQTEENISVLINKQDTNHNILQSLVMQEGISSQDLIVLVELKSKDYSPLSNLYLTDKKPEITQNNVNENSIKIQPVDELTSAQGKITDTNGNVRIINLSDFEGKLSRKIASTLVNDSSDINDAANTANVLKSFESDLFNVLKLDNLSSDSMPSLNCAQSKFTQKSTLTDFETLSMDPTSSINVIPVGNTRKNSQHPSRDFGCNICGRNFTRRNRLNAHLARHSSERPYSCDKCDQRFITRWDLTLHLRIHSGIFSCEFCGKAFPAKGKLERHRRTHTGERPFPCHQCNKAFSEKRNLENHLKTHAAADARKNVLNFSNVYLSCGHFGNISADGKMKSCNFCEKDESTIIESVGSDAGVENFKNTSHISKSDLDGDQVNEGDTSNNN